MGSRHILITGASSGLGQQVCRELLLDSSRTYKWSFHLTLREPDALTSLTAVESLRNLLRAGDALETYGRIGRVLVVCLHK